MDGIDRIPNFCSLPLAQVDDAATWGGTGNCDLSQSTNTCAGDTQFYLGGGADFGDQLFYDQKGELVGALAIGNGIPSQCFGTVPPLDCQPTGRDAEAGTCCEWDGQYVFDTWQGGVCYPGMIFTDAGVDSGDAD